MRKWPRIHPTHFERHGHKIRICWTIAHQLAFALLTAVFLTPIEQTVMLLSLARHCCGWCVICLQSTTMWRLQRVSVSWWRDWRRSCNSSVFSGKHSAGKALAAVSCILRGEEPTVVVKVLLYIHINHRFIRDGKPRMSTSTFTQLLSSESQLLIIIIIETFVMIIIDNFCRALFSDVHRLHFTTFSDISEEKKSSCMFKKVIHVWQLTMCIHKKNNVYVL